MATPRYEPVRLIGRGGLGEVTLARDTDIDRNVAVKRLRSDVTTEDGVDRFADEIRTVGQLEHPNITPIHDVGVDDQGQRYFVMRYVDGETLESIIGKLAAGDRDYHRLYTFEYRTQIFIGVVNAISFAHSKGIVHRDIKPANIMIGTYGEVVVMDWGIAKKVGAPEKPGHVGTPAYMSPEQALGDLEAIDARSDIYSLCVLFYELLALRHYLADKQSLPDMIAGIVHTKPEHASHLRHESQPAVPAELGWLIQRGLEKAPDKRFQSTAELMQAIQRAMSGRFDVHCYVTMMKRGGTGAVRFVNAHPRVAMLAFLGITGIVLFGLVELVLHFVQ
jgi:serine/threonine-protein kinase